MSCAVFYTSLHHTGCGFDHVFVQTPESGSRPELISHQQSLFNFRILYNEIIHVLIHEWNPEHIEFQKIFNIFALSECLSIQDFKEMFKEICITLLRIERAKELLVTTELSVAKISGAVGVF